MKRKICIFLGLLVLLLAAASMWRLRPSMPEGSEMYQRFCDMPGVRVGFVKDFPLNDSVSCDVTTFEALDEEGWERMKEALELQSGIDMKAWVDSVFAAEGFPVENHDNEIEFWKAVRFHPELKGDLLPKGLDTLDCYSGSYHYRWFSVYHCVNKEQKDAVIDALMTQIDEHQEGAPLTRE